MDFNYNNDVTILVNSCDLYEDAWEPFFRLLKKHWENCPNRIYLNTETKQYSSELFDIKIINSDFGATWSERLKKAVQIIESEYILFFLEDFFLRGPVNDEILQMAVKCMENEKDVGAIRFIPHIDSNWCEEGTETYKYFVEIPKKWCARNSTMISLWRKDYLLKIIREYEDPWEFEIYGSVRSRKLNYKVLAQNMEYPNAFLFDYQIKYGYGISKKRWLKNNKELFEKYDIQVNYENLGWYDDIEIKEKIVGLHRTFKEKLLMPFKDPHLFFKIVSIEIERIINKIKHIRNRF